MTGGLLTAFFVVRATFFRVAVFLVVACEATAIRAADFAVFFLTVFAVTPDLAGLTAPAFFLVRGFVN